MLQMDDNSDGQVDRPINPSEQIIASQRGDLPASGVIPTPPINPPDGPGGGGIGIAVILLAVAIGGVWLYVTQQKRRPLTTGPQAGPVFRRSSGAVLHSGPGRASLRCQAGPLVGQQTPLSQPILLVGRSHGCDLMLPDPTVSRQHARLRFTNGVWYLQDQNSKMGTYVNGQRITAVGLRSGDQIRIGDSLFEFRSY